MEQKIELRLRNAGYSVSKSAMWTATNGRYSFTERYLSDVYQAVRDCNNHDDRETLETLEDGTVMVQCRQCGERWEEVVR